MRDQRPSTAPSGPCISDSRRHDASTRAARQAHSRETAGHLSGRLPEPDYCVREMAAKTIFVMLYTGAVTDRDRWIRPDQVTRMTDHQVGRTSDKDRES